MCLDKISSLKKVVRKLAVKDVKLGRLTAVRAEALKFKNEAWQAQRLAWLAYSQARNKLAWINQKLQQVDDLQDELWHNYHRERRENQLLIERLGHRRREFGKKSVRLFRLAKNCPNQKPVNPVLSDYEAENYHYELEKNYLKKRALLVKNNSATKRRMQEALRQLRLAKAERNLLRSRCDDAMTKYLQLQAEFQQAKSDYQAANHAFKLRLRELRDSGRDTESALEVAKRAGVPQKYLDNILVKRAVVSSRYDVYFGGFGHPVGPGHGHYCLIGNQVVYRRDPIVCCYDDQLTQSPSA